MDAPGPARGNAARVDTRFRGIAWTRKHGSVPNRLANPTAPYLPQHQDKDL